MKGWYILLGIVTFFAIASRFVDYLLSTKLRKKEKNVIQSYFGKLFVLVHKGDPIAIQQLVIRYTLKAVKKVFGNVLHSRYIITSLLASQILTITAVYIGAIVAYGYYYYDWRDLHYLIPFAPYIGLSNIISGFKGVDHVVSGMGFFWNNYLCDSIAIVSTVILLKFIKKHPRYFVPIVLLDLLISYCMSYLCLLIYYSTPPHSYTRNLNFLTFIPQMWALKDSWTDLDGRMLFYSLTTFVPIVAYLTFLIFLYICKYVQWILETLFHDFASDRNKTVFFKLSLSLGAMAALVKLVIEVSNT